jgi:hypothetical protein
LLFESWSRDAHGFWSRRSRSAISVE